MPIGCICGGPFHLLPLRLRCRLWCAIKPASNNYPALTVAVKPRSDTPLLSDNTFRNIT